MPIDITIPSPGESITEVVLGPWHRTTGDWVEKDESLVEIESDKVTLEVPAAESGVLAITAEEGSEMRVGDVIGTIDPAAARPAARDGAAVAASAVEVATATASAAGGVATEDAARATSLARKVAADRGVPLTNVRGTGPSGRITKSDVLAATTTTTTTTAGASPSTLPAVAPDVVSVPAPAPAADRGVRRERMSTLRQRIAQRLVAAQQNAAMLTTFNEADMTEVMRLRKTHKESFAEQYGVGLGFMGFFVKACASGLQRYPGLNAFIDGTDVEYHDYVDMAVAVGTPRGLVVPVLRSVERRSFAEIESGIKTLAERARTGQLSLEEMTGGTFTISNGGVYGSLLSTPILNPPQSGILGMHRIMQRAVEDPDHPGQIALRPMMYLALSYDHRIVDGEQAVRFLVHVKECVESPERVLLGI